ncbi:Sulfate adenylyltransferase (ATP-sulfurylase) (Sulfate adenylate transferase) (SAT) [Durusdinium trenchii]|uniref:sulfate adenylyltransferase n=1 Tax=Durusdinium trenchii TaxID=1381693 RepID=A0ABP0JJY3_9DINO
MTSVLSRVALGRVGQLAGVLGRSSQRMIVPAIGARGFAHSAPPRGGKLVDLMVKDETIKQKLVDSADAKVELTERQSCDTELIINGAFSPLTGFMNEDVYDSVVDKMRLPESNLLFGLPVVFDTNRDDLNLGMKVLLTYQGDDIAVLDIESRWTPDKPLETLKCYGTSSLEHPGVRMVAMERGHTYLGGKLHGLNLPKRVFPCKTPAELREELPSKDGKDVVAFQCRNPIHKAHHQLVARSLDHPAVNEEGAVCLIHPTCGPTQEDDIDGTVRYRTYEVLKEELNDPKFMFAYMPYSMHMAGPREAIQHAALRVNYGANCFIVGRDMAGSKSSVTGEDFYGPYDAQEILQEHAAELGVKPVPSLNLVYTAEEGYITADKAEELGLKPLKLSGTEFRKRLRAGEDIPEWFAFPSVVKVLRENN